MIISDKIHSNKQELRKIALVKRELFFRFGYLNKNSNIIVSKILSSDIFKNAKNIALYLPIKNEVDISKILNVKEKNFYLPTCTQDGLQFRLFEGFDKLKNGVFNIPVADGDVISPDDLDIVFVPALLANKKCYRLGYGRGFYDKFFRKFPLHNKKIIVIQSAFISDTFVEDNYDVQCDYILSEL